MVAMKAWLVLCATVALLGMRGADSKRFDPSMVDPLMRRSSLEKNFMRFGRSSPTFSNEDVEESPDSSSVAETSEDENFFRAMRAKTNNLMRFGRSKADNFMRFGRGKQENFMRFGRSRNDNFMRFGRGKQDSYMRFGRGKQDNFMRFGRGKQDSFMRFGRGKQDSYMRFGRGKQDNFIRFGRSSEEPAVPLPAINEEDEMMRGSRGKQDNFMRFGRYYADDSDNDIPIVMRADPGNKMNFMRFGRARQDNFMRFGKSYTKSGCSEESNNVVKNKNQKRCSSEKTKPDDYFIRTKRDSQSQLEEPASTDMTRQRLKRSTVGFFDDRSEFYPVKFEEAATDRVVVPISALPDDLEEEYAAASENSEDFYNRRKRSVINSSTSSPLPDANNFDDQVSVKLLDGFPLQPEFKSSLISAGLPNAIVGPEFSLLPDINPSSKFQKRAQPGDRSFIRLG